MKAPTSLLELQCKIQSAVREKNKQSFCAEATALIKKQPPLAPIQRLSIYQDAFLIRMVDTLAMDFVRLKETLDKEDESLFEKMVEQFIIEKPSCFSSIAEIGQNFSLFLRQHSENWYDLASLDWIEFLSFYTEDDSIRTLTADKVAAGIPFALCLKTSTFFFQSTNKDFLKSKYYVSSKADNNTLYVEEITEQDYLCLQELKEPKNLEQFYTILESSKINLSEAQTKLSNWFTKGLLRCDQDV